MSKRVRLSDNIVEELENIIVQSMKPGEKLPSEMELAEKFSVGRSTIRESLKVLSSKGLIKRGNEGTFVSEKVNKCLIDPLNLLIHMNIGDVEDLLELRQMLEVEAIIKAAQKATPEIINELNHINWQMKEPGLDPESLQNLDIKFHNTIAKATGNTVLMELLNAIRQVIAKNVEDSQMVVGIMEESMGFHQQLVEAMQTKDSEEAHKVMEKYFTLTRQKDVFHKNR